MSKNISSVSMSRYQKPYYLTRERTSEEKEVIAQERKRAKKLTSACVGLGLLFTATYFKIKLLLHKPIL